MLGNTGCLKDVERSGGSWVYWSQIRVLNCNNETMYFLPQGHLAHTIVELQNRFLSSLLLTN
jgi:hypothetical protein